MVLLFICFVVIVYLNLRLQIYFRINFPYTLIVIDTFSIFYGISHDCILSFMLSWLK